MLIPLKLVRDQQLQQQIFDQLRDLIATGRLRAGSRMPSSRMMAEQFAISRMTVLLAYERLIAEGFLETRPASGTFVAHPAAPSQAPVDRSALSLAHRPAFAPPPLHPPPNEPACQGDEAGLTAGGGLQVGRADPSLFPAQRWRSLMRQRLDRPGSQFGSEQPAGNPALRDAIANWLSSSRGLAVSPEQVILVRGRQQAIHLMTQLVSYQCEGRRAARPAGSERSAPGCPVHPESVPHAIRLGGVSEPPRDYLMNSTAGDRTHAAAGPVRVVLEAPTDPIAAAAMTGLGATLFPVPVDSDGLRTDLLPDGDAALVHVTPEHQRPLGCVLARERRAELLDWATAAGALILEEDIDGELRYDNMPLPSLMSLDRSERVVLLGGFGTSLGPWLDMAYLILPLWLVPFARTARRLIDDSRGSLEQLALADFLRSGGYALHLHRLSKVYAGRRDAMQGALRREFGHGARISGGHAGLRLAWFPDDTLPTAAIAQMARCRGLDAATAGQDAVLLGFGASDERHIDAGVRDLARALTGRDAFPPAIARQARV